MKKYNCLFLLFLILTIIGCGNNKEFPNEKKMEQDFANFYPELKYDTFRMTYEGMNTDKSNAVPYVEIEYSNDTTKYTRLYYMTYVYSKEFGWEFVKCLDTEHITAVPLSNDHQSPIRYIYDIYGLLVDDCECVETNEDIDNGICEYVYNVSTKEIMRYSANLTFKLKSEFDYNSGEWITSELSRHAQNIEDNLSGTYKRLNITHNANKTRKNNERKERYNILVDTGLNVTIKYYDYNVDKNIEYKGNLKDYDYINEEVSLKNSQEEMASLTIENDSLIFYSLYGKVVLGK